VAVKVLHSDDEEYVARFRREGRLAARLRHPHIVSVFEIGEVPATVPGESPRRYLVMEFVEGPTLAHVSLSLRQALEVFIQVSHGVEAAHREGIVHRDLKPQNILLAGPRRPCILDFGLAKALRKESSISGTGAIMGTPGFMPPEQARGQLEEVDRQSDVFSLGASLYAVLCGQPPYSGNSCVQVLLKACVGQFASPRSLKAGIPEGVERVLLKAMAREKPDRYLSARDFAHDLKACLPAAP
jgi:serine/threonine-protein kinase